MARKGASSHLKRSAAPKTWRIPRKKHLFVVSPAPGHHRLNDSVPLAVLLRDILKLVSTYREAKFVIHSGKIVVDGVVREDPHFSVGLMDTIEVPLTKMSYRLVPQKGSLEPIEIPDSEKELKICRIKKKEMVRNGTLQLGLHDGRSILIGKESDLSPGDSVLIDLPSQKVVNSFKLNKGNLALVVRGERGGSVGVIQNIKSGSFSREAMVSLSLDGKDTEVPKSLLFSVGTDKPPIKISESA